MLLQQTSLFRFPVCLSWPARTKLPMWSRRLWRNTTCSIWTSGTSPSCSSSPREEVGYQSCCCCWKCVRSLVNRALLVFQTCSYRTRPTFFMPCLRQQTLTLFCTRPQKARRSRCRLCPASDDIPSSRKAPQILWTKHLSVLILIFYFKILFNYKYEIMIEFEMLFVIQKHFMKQEKKLTLTENLHNNDGNSPGWYQL